MNEMILAVLAVIFVAESNLTTRFVPFDRMPKECVSAYRDYAHEVFGATPAQGTEMAEVDFDCDGRNELLVYNGEHGSGGEEWIIFCSKEKGWDEIGEVFGTLSIVKFKTHKGLLVCKPCGWEQAIWEYFEFRRGQFMKQLEITVNYAPPKENMLRDKPQRIEIKIYNEK